MSWRLLLPLGYTAALLLLSSIPGIVEPENDNVMAAVFMWITPAWQNLLHVPLYAGLSMSWIWALEKTLPNPHWRLFTAFVLTFAWGAIDETYQLSVPGRYGSWTDVAMNTVGAALAILYVARMPDKS